MHARLVKLMSRRQAFWLVGRCLPPFGTKKSTSGVRTALEFGNIARGWYSCLSCFSTSAKRNSDDTRVEHVTCNSFVASCYVKRYDVQADNPIIVAYYIYQPKRKNILIFFNIHVRQLVIHCKDYNNSCFTAL